MTMAKTKAKAVKPAKSKKKSSKVESISIKKAVGGFVVDEYRDDYDQNKTHIADDKAAVSKLVDRLLG